MLFHFGAVDCFTRKRVVGLASRLTSEQGAAFLQRVVKELPFPLAAIQSDGGSEFLGAFRLATEELKLPHYFNRPSYPQGNGQIERSFRTDEEEFYQVEDLPADLGRLEAALLGTGSTNRCGPIRLWVTKHPISSTRTGSKIVILDRRHCPICPDPIHAVDPYVPPCYDRLEFQPGGCGK